jgi:hypothetical protein
MFMKCRSIAYATCLQSAVIFGPANASHADLRVAGSILPGAACTVNVGDGLIDLGRISRGDLHPTRPTPLDVQTIRMDINCGIPRRYALAARSASAGTGPKPHDFGLESDADHSPAGGLAITFGNRSATIDGVDAYVTGSYGIGDLASAAWDSSTHQQVLLQNGGYVAGFVTTEGSTEVPSAIKDLDVRLHLTPTIRPANELDLSDEIALSSGVSFEIIYF